MGSAWTGVITRGGMWHPPYHFLGDAGGCSVDRGIIVQQLRCLGEARVGFSSPQGWQEARQGRVGQDIGAAIHRCFLWLLVRQKQLNCLRKLIPRVQILPSVGHSLRWWCWISCSPAGPFTNPSDTSQHCRITYKPFQSRGAKLFLQGMGLSSGLQQVGRGYVLHLPSRDLQALLCLSQFLCPTLSLPISQSHCGAVLVEVRMPLGGSLLVVGVLLCRRLLLAGTTPGTSEDCYQVSQDCLMALTMGFPSGLAG